MMARVALFVLSLAAVPLQPALATCQGRLEGSLQAGGGEYDPFDAVDFRRRQTVAIRNSDTVVCSYIVGFQRQPAQGRLSWILSYRLESASGDSLLITAVPDGKTYILVTNVQPGQTATGEYYLVLPRGQFAFPGTYWDNDVTVSLRPRDVSGSIGAQLDSQVLTVAQPVGARAGINIAGGGLGATLDFGELVKGKERTIGLQARANFAYSITLRSTNGGVMKLDPPVPGQNWAVSYSLSVNSQPVSLLNSVKISRAVPFTTWGQESHLLSFKIEDASDQRSGMYRDVIIVNVSINL